MIPPLTKETKMRIADSVGGAEDVDPIAKDASTP